MILHQKVFVLAFAFASSIYCFAQSRDTSASQVQVSHANGDWTITGSKNTVVLHESDLSVYVRAGATTWNMLPSASDDMLIGSVILGKKGKRPPIKDTAYECGMLPVGSGNTRLSVKFYLVAMLFILFDIEVVFLYPWAAVYKQMLKENAAAILGSMLSFMAILFAGYLYALKKGAFDWKS